MPSTLYVVSGCVGSTSRWLGTEGESQRSMLSWRQLRELDRAGVEIGAHSHSHPQLDTLPSTEAWSEILLSKCQIEDHLGHRVESFAYPTAITCPCTWPRATGWVLLRLCRRTCLQRL